VLVAPFRDQLVHPLRPARAVRAWRRRLDHAAQRHLGVAEDRRDVGVVAAELGWIDVELDDPASGRREHPVVGDLPAGVAADEEHEVGFRQRAVGAVARIGAGDADRERVSVDDRRLGVERGGDRDRQFLGELHHFRLRARADHPAARDNHRPFRAAQRRERRLDMLGIGRGAERRRSPVGLLHQRLELGLLLGDLAEMALHPQVHRAGRARGRHPECLANEVGHAGDVLDLRVELGHRVELADVVDLLVGVAIARLRRRTAGDRDDRRARHEAVAQAGGEVGGADHLRHTHAGLAAGAGIAVGHVGGGLLAVHHHAADGPVFHLGECLEHERRNEEDVRDLVALHHLGKQLRTCHFGHGRLTFFSTHYGR
jgi:hypothetical protein